MSVSRILKSKKVLWFWIVIGITILSMEVAKSETSHMNRPNDKKMTKYYFEMDQKTRKEFLSKVSLIKRGDSVAKVKSILGEPTCDERLVSKQGIFKARVLSYYIKIWKKNIVNDKYDRLVSFYFDDKDQLVKTKSNVD